MLISPLFPALRRSDLVDVLRLIRTPQVGPVTFFGLVTRFGTPAKALEALPELAKRGGRKVPLKAIGRAEAEKEIEATAKAGAWMLLYGEDFYPPALMTASDAPPLLIGKGHGHLLAKARPVAMVGARNASASARQFARQLSAGLGKAGCLVVSGLARGIDAEAHAGALATGTVGVSAVGIDQVYPPQHDDLYARMFEAGCVVTEQRVGTVALPALFPARNRIIAGMSALTVVVEASPKSGSLITARMALDYGREVGAVPGSPLDPRCQGANLLLKEGAHLIGSVEDALEALGARGFDEKPPVIQPVDAAAPMDEDALDEIRAEVMGLLSPSPVSVDELAKACQSSPRFVLAALVELELAGRVERHPGNRVSLVSVADVA